ncbi:MAG: RsmD family RNA methyltransferase [Verrucomicrobiota bacterium]
MRITGGKARGILLKAPKGRETRPATDRLRESVFSSLGSRIEGARVADLFAGTGAYGLEAMSRGASGGIFVENSSEVIFCLRENLAAVSKSCGHHSAGGWRILAQKIYAINASAGLFDVVFIDPPYALIEPKIQTIFSDHIASITTRESLVCFEMPGTLEVDIPGWRQVRRLGKTGRDKPTAVFFERD